MSRLSYLALLVAVGIGGYYFFSKYEVRGLQNLKIQSRTAKSGSAWQPSEIEPGQPPVRSTGQKSIRIATVNLGPLDRQKLSKRHVVRCLVEVIRRFDVVAVQDIRAHNQGVLVDLVEQINSVGRYYDFATSPQVGREPVEQYCAFLFDRAAVQIDRSTVHLVEDPAHRFLRQPLVAAFRVCGPTPEEAFTFSLINVHVDPNRADIELDLLADVFRAVRDDGRGEDDVILLGDLGADERHLGRLGQVPNITWSTSGVPTTTGGTRLVDNILFDSRATTEFVGRSGVMDLMREFDMSLREVVEISDHLPVWAEFSLYEGGQAGHLVGSGSQNATR